MFESKYNKLLTVILIVVIVAIVCLLGYLGIDFYQKFANKKEVDAVMDDYSTSLNEEATNNPADQNAVAPQINETAEDTQTTGKKATTYKGYNVVGLIEIPKISLKYPILERVTTKSIEIAVAVLYGPGPNQVGNTVIAGHNYRNGAFFGKNKKLSLGDKIYITDNSGARLEYKIYNIYETSPDDGDYIQRDTKGKREISLTTCTDNSKGRLIIWAVED